MSNLKQISIAMEMYLADNNDEYPRASSMDTLKPILLPYTKSGSVFTSLNPLDPEYAFFAPLASRRVDSISDTAAVPEFFNRSPWNDGKRNVAFADAHARRIPESDFPKLCFDAGANFKPSKR